MVKIAKNVHELLAAALVFTLAGCKTGGSAGQPSEKAEIREIAERVKSVAESLDLSAGNSPFLETFRKASDEEKILMALDLADDMALAPPLELTTEEMLAIAGEVVQAYPHPLLLNNYAAMLSEAGSAQDALFFLMEGLAQNPGHPVILTNIANTYIELDDFAAAEEYAKQAVAVMNDYGPAWQVLTTVHLRNGNNELAAEAMIKSAKLGFNELTMHHFDSFIESVAFDLVPGKDKYPLREKLLDELYEIARTLVDAADVRDDVDTPEARIVIPTFPAIASAEHLMKLQDFLLEQSTDMLNQYQEPMMKHDSYADAYWNHIYEESDREGNYPFLKNMRQIYALNLLDSYYTFKLNENHYAFAEKYAELSNRYTDERTRLEYMYPPESSELNNGIYQACKRFVTEVLNEMQASYNVEKQLLEEYWLKTGGLMKYLVDEEILQYYQTQREAKVLLAIQPQITDLAELAMGLQILYLRAAISNGHAAYIEQERLSGSLAPDLGAPIVMPWPEKDPLTGYFLPNAVKFEHSFLGYELKLTGGLNGIQTEFRDNLTKPPSQNKKILRKEKFEKRRDFLLVPIKALANLTPTAVPVGKLSQIKIDRTKSAQTAEYMTFKRGGITDRGTLRTEEVSLTVQDYTASMKTEIRQSHMTGVVEINKSATFKYQFTSVEGNLR